MRYSTLASILRAGYLARMRMRVLAIAIAIAAAVLAASAVPASAQTGGPTIGIASVIGGGHQETTWTWQNHADCGGGIDSGEGELAQFSPTGPPPSVAIVAMPGHVRASPVASLPMKVQIDRPVYYGPERMSSTCDSPSAEEDCGTRTAAADLMLLPTTDGVEIRGGASPRNDPFVTCYRPASVVDFPEIVPARAPISPGVVTVGAFDLSVELHGGPVAFSLPHGSGTTTSTFRFRLIGGVAPLLSLKGSSDATTADARGGAVRIPVECSSAGRCSTTLALRPAGAKASQAGAKTAIPRPVKERTSRDLGRKKVKLRAGKRGTVRLKVGKRRGAFDLIVSQTAAGRRLTYAAARIRVR
jgi:hypothetical protein